MSCLSPVKRLTQEVPSGESGEAGEGNQELGLAAAAQPAREDVELSQPVQRADRRHAVVRHQEGVGAIVRQNLKGLSSLTTRTHIVE